MAFKLIEPPPLQPQMPMRSASMYGALAQDFFHGRGLVVGGQHADLVKNRLAPGPAARGGRAAVVEAHDDVAVLSEHLVPEVVAAAPAIEHSLAGGLAVHMHQQGILRIRIEIGRKQAPAVEGDVVSDIDTEELASGLVLSASILSLSDLLSDEHANGFMRRQPDQRGFRDRVERGKPVDGPAGVRRDLVAVRARLGRGRDSLWPVPSE